MDCKFTERVKFGCKFREQVKKAINSEKELKYLSSRDEANLGIFLIGSPQTPQLLQKCAKVHKWGPLIYSTLTALQQGLSQ